jgi:cell division protein FtsB
MEYLAIALAVLIFLACLIIGTLLITAMMFAKVVYQAIQRAEQRREQVDKDYQETRERLQARSRRIKKLD